MLTTTQKERLLNRKELKKSKSTRQQTYYNDMQVKKALKKYLDDADEAILVFEELPDEATEDTISIEHIQRLFALIEKALSAKGVVPVSGNMIAAGLASKRDIQLARLIYANVTDLQKKFGPDQEFVYGLDAVYAQDRLKDIKNFDMETMWAKLGDRARHIAEAIKAADE